MDMPLAISFNGAARNVTGSSYLVEANGKTCLVDCGLFQERDFRARNWEPFPFAPASLDAVILTHAHLDHCGLLPKLVRDGFDGPIYCTAATADIARIVLLDAAHLQEEDAAFKQRRHRREKRQSPHPVVPLYTTQDAERVLPKFQSRDYDTPFELGEGVMVTLREAGHILGSASVSIDVTRSAGNRRILFSGDLGRCNVPILRDPAPIDRADYVVTESTYGNRLHRPTQEAAGALADAINRTHKAGGNVLIPSFAVERTQEVLYHLNGLLADDRIPHLRVFVDSPMAVRVTEVFNRHPELFDEEARRLLATGEHPCDFPGLTMCQSIDESKSINHIRGTSIIIAGSGMCTGGRIKHHLVQNISRPESTLLFVGYQAVGTLGRIILEGAENVRILGQEFPVRAHVTKINSFSAHADRDELWHWLSSLGATPRRAFVTHGETRSAHDFADFLKQRSGWKVTIPSYKDRVLLD